MLYGHKLEITISEIAEYINILKFFEMKAALKDIEQSFSEILFQLDFANTFFKILDVILQFNFRKAMFKYFERLFAVVNFNIDLAKKMSFCHLSDASFNKLLPHFYVTYYSILEEN
jgi:hypothetical protein